MTRKSATKPARRRPSRQVLPVIAGLFVASGLVRMSGTAGAVLAEETSLQAAATEPATTGPVSDAGTDALLAAFRAREIRVAEREAQIEDRIQAMRVAEAEIDEKLSALAQAEASLAATLAMAQTAASDDLTRLTAVYENMKAANAAALFAEMDPAFAAGFLGMMRADAAAAIMTRLEPDRAYSISVILAGRNANAPTE